MSYEKEKWIDAFGFEEYYEVSDMGRIRDKRTGKHVNMIVKNDHYTVTLTKEKGDRTKVSAKRLIFRSFYRNHNTSRVLFTKNVFMHPLVLMNIGIKDGSYYSKKSK